MACVIFLLLQINKAHFLSLVFGHAVLMGQEGSGRNRMPPKSMSKRRQFTRAEEKAKRHDKVKKKNKVNHKHDSAGQHTQAQSQRNDEQCLWGKKKTTETDMGMQGRTGGNIKQR